MTYYDFSQEACGMISLSRAFGIIETSDISANLAQPSKNKESFDGVHWGVAEIVWVNQRSTYVSNFKLTQMMMKIKPKINVALSSERFHKKQKVLVLSTYIYDVLFLVKRKKERKTKQKQKPQQI